MRSLLLFTALALTPAVCVPQGTGQDATTRKSQDAEKHRIRAEAFRARQKGDMGRAGDLFRKLSELDPSDPEPRLMAAECYEKATRYNDALDVLERGRKRFPSELKFSVGIARNYNLKGHHMLNSTGKFDNHVLFTLQDCVRECESVLQKHAGSRDMRLILAQTLYTLNELGKCRAHCEELVKRFPDHPGAYILLGNLTTADYVKRLQATREQGADTSKETMEAVAKARDRAKAHYEKALSLDARRTIAYRKLGDLHAWNGDRNNALARYAEALVLDPTHGVSHAWIRGNFADPARRHEFYKKTAEAHMKSPDADKRKVALLWWYAAGTLYEQKKWKESEDLYLATVAADPNRLDSYFWAMWAAIQGNANTRAGLHAAKYSEVAPIHFADTMRRQGEATKKAVLEKLERWAFTAYEAGLHGPARDMNHVIAAVKDTAEAWNNYAFLCRETKMYKESYEAYKNAVQVAPEDGQILNDAAVILDFHLGTATQLRQAEAAHKKLMKTRRMIAYESPPMDGPSLTKQAKANLKKAAAMYKEAAGLADRALKSGELKGDDVERMRTARRDAHNNLRVLKRRLK